MRFLFVFMLFFGVFTQASGQGGIDTLGLTGTMADTVVAGRLENLMNLKLNEKKLDEAEKTIHLAIGIYAQINGDVNVKYAKALANLGLVKYKKKEFLEAVDNWNKCLDFYKRNVSEDDLFIAEVLDYTGNAYEEQNIFDDAKNCFLKSYELRKKKLAIDDPLVLQSYNNLGYIYSVMGEYKIGISYFSKVLNLSKVNENEIAMACANLATTYGRISDYKNAIYYNKMAEKFYLKNPIEFKKELSNCINTMGVIYSLSGDYFNGIRYFERSLSMLLLSGGEEHYYVGTCYHNIGSCYTDLGEHSKALPYLLKGLEIRKRTLGEKNPFVYRSLTNIGNVFYRLKDYENAICYYFDALEVQKSNYGESHPDISTTYINLAQSFRLNNQYDVAFYYYMAAKYNISNFKELEKDYNIEIYSSLGKYYFEKSKIDSAIYFYKKSIDFNNYQEKLDLNAVPNLEYFISSMNELSYIYQLLFDSSGYKLMLDSSVDYIINSIKCIDFIQIKNYDNSSKSFHHSQNYPIYEQAISVSLLKADVDHNDTLRHNTFTYAEKSKAALLQAQIKAADALAFAGIPDSLLEQEHNLRIDITWREKQRQSLLDKGLTETDTNVLRISGIVFDLKQQYETLKKRFETECPDYYRLKYDLSTVPLAYVQDTLLQKDQALLEYFTGDSSLFLFVVRPDTFLVQEVKRDFPLEAWIDSLRFGLYGYYTADKSLRSESLREAALNSYIRYAQLLQQKLIAPVAAWLPGKVILVPDGPLGYIPFDALLSAEPEDRNNFKSYPYLLQKHQFSYTYSATLLREMRDKKHRREPQYDFAAFAPFYNGDTTLLAGMYAYDDLMRKDLQPLAFSGPEVAAAAKLMKGETIAGAAATEERFTSTAGNYRILHLATHGRADNRVGDYAFLAFNEIKDSIENELLYVKDLYNLQLNADLVVLSACETGIGKLQRGEGIISLARAFAYAGAKSIVTSLWSVNDKSTSELMRFFYRELRRGKDKDEALRLARQRLIREATVRNSHPFFWAAFVPLGDMRGVK
ncbi:MAG: CHAT domain-containing protein [Chitinophagales bacterium]|nr:CHAT domain-containing protein [Chitinophagales bacterium]